MWLTSPDGGDSLLLPEPLARRYARGGWGAGWYARLRWRLCPFQRIASLFPAEGTILDLGCGGGLLAHALTVQSGRRVIGMDRSSSRVELARRTTRPEEEATFLVGDALVGPPWPSCDSAVLTDVLHHLPRDSQGNLIRRLFSHLPSGGTLLLLEVVERPRWKHAVVSGIDHFLNPGIPIAYRTHQGWLDLLRGAGFQVLSHPAHENLPLSDAIFLCRKQ